MSNKLLEDQEEEEDMERDPWPRFFKAFLLCCPTSVTLCCSGGAGILWLYTLSEPLLKVRGGVCGRRRALPHGKSNYYYIPIVGDHLSSNSRLDFNLYIVSFMELSL